MNQRPVKHAPTRLASLATLPASRGGISSQRQLGLAGGVAPRGRCGRVDLREGPAHARHLAGTAVDDELHSAARALRSGEKYAFLQSDRILVGFERPRLAVR